jgi:NADH dehydrogenase FAD-containing subunit
MPFVLGKPEPKVDQKWNKTLHSLGKRDAVAEILMMVRNMKGDTNSVIAQIANQLLAVDPEHPHALWVKEHLKQKT